MSFAFPPDDPKNWVRTRWFAPVLSARTTPRHRAAQIAPTVHFRIGCPPEDKGCRSGRSRTGCGGRFTAEQKVRARLVPRGIGRPIRYDHRPRAVKWRSTAAAIQDLAHDGGNHYPEAMPVAIQNDLASVRGAIVSCERCPRLRAYCGRIARDKKPEFRDWIYWGRPVPGFGDPGGRLMVVGLAPAAHGGNRT